MSKLKVGVALVLSAIMGAGFAYYMMPAKVEIKTVTKIVEKTHVDKDVKTTTTKKPDGSVVVVVEDKSKVDTKTDTDSKTVNVKLYNRPDWMLSGSYLINRDGKALYEGSLSRRIIGGIYLGAIVNSQGFVGVGVTLVF